MPPKNPGPELNRQGSLPSAQPESEALDPEIQAYEDHRDGVYRQIIDYADENELDDGFVAAILLDLAVSTRMGAYAYGVEKPSVAGLKLELDRFRRDVDGYVGSAKKDAGVFIEETKAARAAEAEQDVAEDKPDSARIPYGKSPQG